MSIDIDTENLESSLYPAQEEILEQYLRICHFTEKTKRAQELKILVESSESKNIFEIKLSLKKFKSSELERKFVLRSFGEKEIAEHLTRLEREITRYEGKVARFENDSRSFILYLYMNKEAKIAQPSV